MSLLARADLPEDYAPFRAFRERLGFVPAIFPAQSLLPRAIEAQAAIIHAFLLAPGALPWTRREEILVAVSASHRNRYCVAVHAHILQSLGCPEEDIEAIAGGTYAASFEEGRTALLDFSVRLSLSPWAIGAADFEHLRAFPLTDAQILEAIQTSALAQLLCTISTGLAVDPEFVLSPRIERAMARAAAPAAHPPAARPAEPPVTSVALAPEAFPPFAFLKKSFGFVPRLYRAQTLRPEALEAEVQAIRDILLTEDVLTRRQKEYILLAVSAANLDTYHVAVHGELLRALGVESQAADRVATDHRHADISESDKALLDFAVKLATRPLEYGEADARALAGHGFTDAQILEAIVMTALAGLLNALEAGLAPKPDFKPRRDLRAARAAQVAAAAPEDPDGPLAARARVGDAEAFEALVRRHQGLVYRTLVGITGNAEDAEDGSQAVFVNAFRKIRDFAGAARFSTWLTRIAINEGLERLRRRRPTASVSLDVAEEEEIFRPSLVAPWVEDPERAYAREEMRQIVRQELARLPLPYRTAVLLRDIEQLSTSEAAAALDLPVATLKTRLLRGRLMMREALAAYFAGGGNDGARHA